jgi:protein-disulfide isomerase/uncharacterized membrane protein
MASMLGKRAAAATVILALVGLAITGVIASVHSQLVSSPEYASFCNVNESVNCDVVLSSEYAYFAGVALPWWAGINYAIVFVLALVAWRAERVTRRRQAAGALFAVALWGFAYSAYLAYVSLAVLQAVCLLCSGLYLVQIGLLVSTWLLFAAARTEGRRAAVVGEIWEGRTRFILGGAVAALGVFLALAVWEARSGGSTGALNAEELAERNPEFYRWYMGLPVAAVDSAGGHRKGDGGSVVVVEFSDFECGHCAKAFRELKRVLPRFANDVTLVFHHFPLNSSCNPAVDGSLHRFACLAAIAAECAAEQGRFWEYHDLLFANQSSLDRDSLLEYADRLGMKREEFVSCLESDRARRRVENDAREGARLKITSTPTLFLNGRTVTGALAADKLEYAIRLERAQHRAPS